MREQEKFSPEEVWVAVLAELVQDKPVPNLPFAESFYQISELLFCQTMFRILKVQTHLRMYSRHFLMSSSYLLRTVL